MNGIFKRLLAAAPFVLLPVHPGAAESALTVVELFTSQACSSCPPADTFLGELAKRDDVLALSFHVDYWDYTGWKDSFASPANTRRQRSYADRLNLRYVYTPQMVIQGAYQAVGSDRSAVLARIERSSKRSRLAIDLRHLEDQLVAFIAGGPAIPADVVLVAYDANRTTTIGSGENRGRTLNHFNVVRRLERIGTWQGEAVEISIPLQPLRAAGYDGCAVLLQSRDSGEILGGAKIFLR